MNKFECAIMDVEDFNSPKVLKSFDESDIVIFEEIDRAPERVKEFLMKVKWPKNCKRFFTLAYAESVASDYELIFK